jgi:hypothetical protein
MKRQAKSYSIVDHELLHGGYLSRLSHEAMVLYLFLTVVGDSTGKSFYSEKSVSRILRISSFNIIQARNELNRERLIEYRHPYWRVLTLTYPRQAGKSCLEPLIKNILTKSEVIKHD